MLDLLSLLSFGQGGWGGALLMGALVTISLTLCCIPFGLPLGLLVAVGTRSRRRLCGTQMSASVIHLRRLSMDTLTPCSTVSF